jgi:twitching motility two-component system response regulator PilH
VIIVSNKSMDTDKIWGLRQGAKDYIAKPVGEKELIAKIRAVLSA